MTLSALLLASLIGLMLASCTSAPVPVPTSVLTPIPTATRAAPLTSIPVSSPSPTNAPSVGASATDTPTILGPRVVIGQAVIPVELSMTDAQHAQGLSDRPGMTPGTGMLFIYQVDALYGFWMRHMHFPLDFVWIGAGCTVVSLTLNAPAAPATTDSQLTIYEPSSPVRYILEINGGDAARFSIHQGDRVAFQGRSLESTACFAW